MSRCPPPFPSPPHSSRRTSLCPHQHPNPSLLAFRPPPGFPATFTLLTKHARRKPVPMKPTGGGWGPPEGVFLEVNVAGSLSTAPLPCLYPPPPSRRALRPRLRCLWEENQPAAALVFPFLFSSQGCNDARRLPFRVGGAHWNTRGPPSTWPAGERRPRRPPPYAAGHYATEDVFGGEKPPPPVTWTNASPLHSALEHLTL